MTYAPEDLKAIQRYAQAKTGQDWASLGITHQTPNGGGYHEGHDLLHAAGVAPEDPGSDYSYTESPRDRSGLTDAASAFDFGDGFGRFFEFNAWIVGRARAGDPRCRDIREIIHTLDGQTVRRWDALGVRSSGDSSHLTHTHFSFFRDSEGRRAQADNFLGLLQEFFDGANPEVPDVLLTDDFDIPNWDKDPNVPSVEHTKVYVALGVASQRSTQALRAVQACRADVAGVNLKIEALAKAISAGGGSADMAGVIAHVDQGLAQLSAQESATVQALQTRIDRLQAALAAAEQAGGAALTQS